MDVQQHRSCDPCDSALECIEEYEKSVETKKIDEIIPCQYTFLYSINNYIQHQNSNLYITSLLCIRDDLLKQIKIVEERRDKIQINDLTITRVSNFNFEPVPDISIPFNSWLSEKLNPGPIPNQIKPKPVDNQAEKLKKIIQNTLIEPRSKGFSEIAGLTEAKKLLKEAIIFPIKYPHLFTGDRKKWNKALLYGPPGTGKTLLAHCLAAQVKANLYCISNSDLLSCYVGESEKLIAALFKHCQENKEQSLIFMDEIDSICRQRSSSDSEHGRRLKNQLLTQLSELDGKSNKSVFFLASTNCPWELDSAFVRRFEKRIYIPLPDRETRLELIKVQTKSSNNLIKNIEWETVLEKTEGWSGSDLSNLVNFALLQPIRELSTATNWIKTNDNCYMPTNNKTVSIKSKLEDLPNDKVTCRSIDANDFFTGLIKVKKTVSEESLKKFEEFNNIFQSL